jgi:hypothetical protein
MSSGSIRPRIEIRGHRGADIIRIAAETVREDRAFEHVDRNSCRLIGDVHDLAVTPTEPLDCGIGGFDHCSAEAQHSPEIEQRRQGPALKLPLIGFYGQQTVRQSRRQNTALQPILSIVVGIDHEHAPDGTGVTDDGDPTNRQPAHDNGLLEMGRRPRFERIVCQNAKQ